MLTGRLLRHRRDLVHASDDGVAHYEFALVFIELLDRHVRHLLEHRLYLGRERRRVAHDLRVVGVELLLSPDVLAGERLLRDIDEKPRVVVAVEDRVDVDDPAGGAVA